MNILKNVLLFVFIFFMNTCAYSEPVFTWKENSDKIYSIANIAEPSGYKRVITDKNSFQEWLRYLPVKKNDSEPIRIHNGSKYGEYGYTQDAHYRIVDIDVMPVQQCADVAIRLWAEYLWSTNQADKIKFKFTSGHSCSWTDWKNGKQLDVEKNKVVFKSKTADASRKNFLKYLTRVMYYAGTSSLKRDLKKIDSLNELRIGDILIRDGHACMVADMTVNDNEEKKIVIIQGWMPNERSAEDVHILKEPESNSPWHYIGETIKTRRWKDFTKSDIRRFE